ncbi:uncharacterized protein L969DRAFT_42443 [Mixia osmundae IAM 14324]|uniref:Rgp1-domain-containing protein n=1 Tax=Mixia osmundae (strain CBS 9802 / IAM 14324 / JCM 22182 / KY 12970) TaxID=764103 RepID=G7E2T9_MIXOS|nr:uncharacterized protein L969DRAFT_42443 [Mixia osmundae IAM 14324]KEI42427.1 hypothetical protein L969DRAFT_42443 [Mixia osmundae IAM 14324]GAA97283.1 hypothetical protein E5Q_03961 [Mixia osmundae IAM 14324]
MPDPNGSAGYLLPSSTSYHAQGRRSTSMAGYTSYQAAQGSSKDLNLSEAEDLQITVEPAQSAYFAGELFQCRISLCNLQAPVEHTPGSNGLKGKARAPVRPARLRSVSSNSVKLGHAPRPSLGTALSTTSIKSERSLRSAPIKQDVSTSPHRRHLVGHSLRYGDNGPQEELSSDSGPEEEARGPSNGLYANRRMPGGHRKNMYSINPALDDLGTQQIAQSYAGQTRAAAVKRSARSQQAGVSTPRKGQRIPAIPVPIEEDDPEQTPKPKVRPSMERFKSQSPSDSIKGGSSRSTSTLGTLSRDDQTDAMAGSVSDNDGDEESVSSFANHRPSVSSFSSFDRGARVRSAPPWLNQFRAPNGLTIQWASAQFDGRFEIDEALVKPAEFLAVKRSIFGGDSQLNGIMNKSGLIGGGSLSYAEPTGSTWTRWLWSQDTASSVVASPTTPSSGTLEDRRQRGMSDKSVPVFNTPPSLLSIDQHLEPGETKSYSFSLRLPGDLPPTFTGKTIKFVYELLVSVQKQVPDAPGLSKPVYCAFRVPIRLYNHVDLVGARPFYDLTNPVIWHRDECDVKLEQPTVPFAPTAQDHYSSAAQRNAVDRYAASLVNAALREPIEAKVDDDEQAELSRELAKTALREPAARSETKERTTGSNSTSMADELTSCRNAVDFVSRNSPKVSYEIKKDGYAVAHLTLVKSAYRLGETVLASMRINDGDARVLKVSARLETYELVETSISVKPAAQVRQFTRRLHAEHHEITLDAGRVTAALSIPSGQTPDFATSGVKLQWSVRFSFLVLPPEAVKLPETPLSRMPVHGRSPSVMPNGSARIAPDHARSPSFTFGSETPLTPLPTKTGTHHLMPAIGVSTPTNAVYRGVPDLDYLPVLFKSREIDKPTLSRKVSLEPLSSPTLSRPGSPAHSRRPSAGRIPQVEDERVKTDHAVLMPSRHEVVECSLPIRVYPSSTSYRPAVSHFFA